MNRSIASGKRDSDRALTLRVLASAGIDMLMGVRWVDPVGNRLHYAAAVGTSTDGQGRWPRAVACEPAYRVASSGLEQTASTGSADGSRVS